MRGLSRLAIRRPRLILGLWLVVVVALGLLGTGVQSRLKQSVFILPDTETARAYEIAKQQFGENVIIPILLEGPPKAIDRQGPKLSAALAARSDTRVLSPWERAKGTEKLRPAPGEAMIVTTFDIPLEQAFDTLAPEVREAVDQVISPPVQAHVTGMPIIGNDVKQETYDSATRAELLALPILAIVLLLVFRAPVAALIPGLCGLSTLFASAGLIWLLAGFLSIDPIAVALASMMGLALGVDYSLLISQPLQRGARTPGGRGRAIGLDGGPHGPLRRRGADGGDDRRAVRRPWVPAVVGGHRCDQRHGAEHVRRLHRDPGGARPAGPAGGSPSVRASRRRPGAGWARSASSCGGRGSCPWPSSCPSSR